jgi:hypothetical protein
VTVPEVESAIRELLDAGVVLSLKGRCSPSGGPHPRIAAQRPDPSDTRRSSLAQHQNPRRGARLPTRPACRRSPAA